MHYGHDKAINKAIVELKAESVAYVVATHFGLTDLASPSYIALHGADSGKIMTHLEHIRKIAQQIIKAFEPSSHSQN